MHTDKFQPIDAESLNKKAKALAMQARSTVVEMSRAAVANRHLYDLEMRRRRSAMALRKRAAARFARVLPFLKR